MVVALPANQLRWLGLDIMQVTQQLADYGFRTILFGDKVPRKLFLDKEVLSLDFTFPSLLLDCLRYAVCVECETLEKEIELLFPVVSEKWRSKLIDIFRVTKALFELDCPDVVVLVQGYEPSNAVARALALEKGIPIIALENTALSGKMIWDDVSGITTNRNLAKNYYWKYRNTISKNEITTFEHEVALSLCKYKSLEHTTPVNQLVNLPNKPIILFLGQVYTDSSVIFGLNNWKTPLEILHELARWCIENNYHLVIKLHPKEATGKAPMINKPYNRLTYQKIQEDRVLSNLLNTAGAMIDSNNDYDTYGLINLCSLAVTINSQSGLEAAMLKKPVVVCGDCFYSGLGFTLEAPSPGTLSPQIDRALTDFDPEGAIEFGYIFFERYCRPKNIASLIELIIQSRCKHGYLNRTS